MKPSSAQILTAAMTLALAIPASLFAQEGATAAQGRVPLPPELQTMPSENAVLTAPPLVPPAIKRRPAAQEVRPPYILDPG